MVGGGLAGITSALDLADRGEAVTLLETRARLGGLTTSFQRDGLWVDNGQHVFLRCCSAYRGLLARLGSASDVTLQDRLRVVMRSEATQRVGTMSRTKLPAPLHLSGALLRHPWMSPRDRLGAARAALALREVDRDSPGVDTISFGDWLRDHGASARAIETLWDLVGVATLNAHSDQASLGLAATVFQIGLLESNDGADIGWARVPLHRLHGAAAMRELELRGVRVCLRSRVRQLRQAGEAWSVRLDDGSVDVDQVVLATPPSTTAELVPASVMGLEDGFAQRLGSSPIINLHLIVDTPVLDDPFIAAVDSPLQWIFDRTASSGLHDGQYLVVSLSAADDLVRLPVERLRTWAMPHLTRLLPALRHTPVRDFFVTREPHATFRPAPGNRADRARARTHLPGLSVAGAWTDTGWPATMEGAVRSGHAAATSLSSQAPVTRNEVAA